MRQRQENHLRQDLRSRRLIEEMLRGTPSGEVLQEEVQFSEALVVLSTRLSSAWSAT